MVLTVFLLGALGQVSHAQHFAFGLKGGVNLSRLSMGDFLTTRYDAHGNPYLKYDGKEVRDNLNESIESRTGWVGGVFFRFGKTIHLQPEVLVSTKGGRFDIVEHDTEEAVRREVDVRYSSIDVPVLLGLKLGPLRVNGGPMASFRIGENQKLKDAFRYYTSQSFDDAVAKSVLGYQFGGGLDLFGLNIDVRKEGSFTEVAAFQVSQGGETSTVRQKLSSWQVTLGIKF